MQVPQCREQLIGGLKTSGRVSVCSSRICPDHYRGHEYLDDDDEDHNRDNDDEDGGVDHHLDQVVGAVAVGGQQGE